MYCNCTCVSGSALQLPIQIHRMLPRLRAGSHILRHKVATHARRVYLWCRIGPSLRLSSVGSAAFRRLFLCVVSHLLVSSVAWWPSCFASPGCSSYVLASSLLAGKSLHCSPCSMRSLSSQARTMYMYSTHTSNPKLPIGLHIWRCQFSAWCLCALSVSPFLRLINGPAYVRDNGVPGHCALAVLPFISGAAAPVFARVSLTHAWGGRELYSIVVYLRRYRPFSPASGEGSLGQASARIQAGFPIVVAL